MRAESLPLILMPSICHIFAGDETNLFSVQRPSNFVTGMLRLKDVHSRKNAHALRGGFSWGSENLFFFPDFVIYMSSPVAMVIHEIFPVMASFKYYSFRP